MFSRAFYVVFPLFVVLCILAVSAGADEKHEEQSFREAVEKDHADDLASPDIPDPEDQPLRPQQTGGAKQHEEHQMEAYVSPVLTATLTPSALEKGKETAMVLTLKDGEGKGLGADKLVLRHTQKVHLLAVDDSLTDYHHIHPVAGKEEGAYEFSFTPKTGHNYMLYADVKPEGGAPQMVPVPMKGTEACADPCIDKAVVNKAVFDGNTVYLSFPRKSLRVGEAARADLFLNGPDNVPLKTLEPVMGAYAHIVAFYEGQGGVAHAHPMGAEPGHDSERGASPLAFMLHAEKAGFMKIFIQIRIGGKDIFLPFSVFVEP